MTKIKVETNHIYGYQSIRKHYDSDLGYDLVCPKNITLKKGKFAKIPLGIKIKLPKGYGAFIKDRSSMAWKGIHVLGGVIDNDYIGELQVILINFGKKYKIKRGDKIAQLVLIKTVDCDVEFVYELESTKRGDKGFGSSGR